MDGPCHDYRFKLKDCKGKNSEVLPWQRQCSHTLSGDLCVCHPISPPL